MITEKQKLERKLGIGGSDIPVIMGISPYKTPYQLYLEKIGDQSVEEKLDGPKYWGNKLESIIREEFSERNVTIVETPDTLIHPDYDFLRANVDGYIPSWNSILEIKCVSSFKTAQWGKENTDEIPMHHLAQVAYYCAIKNAKSAHIAVLIGGNEYREYIYKKDIQLENYLIEMAKKFWTSLNNRIPPYPVNIDDLNLIFPNNKDKKKIFSATHINEEFISLNKINNEIKRLSLIEEKHKFNIMNFMGDSENLVDNEGNLMVSWKTNKRGSRVFLIKNK